MILFAAVSEQHWLIIHDPLLAKTNGSHKTVSPSVAARKGDLSPEGVEVPLPASPEAMYS